MLACAAAVSGPHHHAGGSVLADSRAGGNGVGDPAQRTSGANVALAPARDKKFNDSKCIVGLQ